MSESFAKPKPLGKLKVELDLFNYATKTDLKNATEIDTSSFAKKVDLRSLKSNVDELDIDKLKNVPTNLSNVKIKVDKLDVDKLLPIAVDLSKLSKNVVKNGVVKKDVYNGKIKDIDDKIPDIRDLAFTTYKKNVQFAPTPGRRNATNHPPPPPFPLVFLQKTEMLKRNPKFCLKPSFLKNQTLVYPEHLSRTRHLSGTFIAKPDICLEHCLDANNTYTNYSCGHQISVDPLSFPPL